MRIGWSTIIGRRRAEPDWAASLLSYRPDPSHKDEPEGYEMKRSIALIAAAVAFAAPTFAQAPMRSLADPVKAHADPESLFTSKDPQINKNKQAALHIM